MNLATEPKVNPKREFPRVNKMLYQLAWRVASTRFPFEEAKTEAYYGFMQACYTYDPERGTKFSSWCYYKVKAHLKTFMMEKARDPLSVALELKESNGGAVSTARREFREIIEDLSDLSRDAREIIDLLLDVPFDVVLTKPKTPYQLLKRVCEHWSYERGLDPVCSEITIMEIRARFEKALA